MPLWELAFVGLPVCRTKSWAGPTTLNICGRRLGTRLFTASMSDLSPQTSDAVHDAPKRRTLYPASELRDSGYLKVSGVHSIFWEEHGNPDGVPVVFLHGGPGGGIEARSHRFFDPDAYRIVSFSQRGCGKSTPRGCLEDNTTWSLVSDIEALRTDRGIESWVVFGGSWGSTLSLAYAQTHPNRVRALVLRGIFALRQAEIAWFYERGGAELLMPAEFEQYLDGLPKEMRHRSSLLDAFHEVLNGDDAEAATRAAVAWSRWEGACTYIETVVEKNKYEEPEFAAVFARIEAHFFKNKGFFERDGFLLEPEQMVKIQHIPTVIVQGRWDLICPMRTAYDLKKGLPSAQLTIVSTAGHSAYEPSITSNLVLATDRFKAIAKA